MGGQYAFTFRLFPEQVRGEGGREGGREGRREREGEGATAEG